MLDSFLTFINQHALDLKEQPTLLAVSGGVDSVVMAHLFHKMGFKAGIAHCNFGLRGEESDGDEQFVQELAAAYGFPFYTTHLDAKSLSSSASVSTQMAARELRYAWFEEIREQCGYQWIATAHHANDSFETVILNLARGTGLPGLHGIAAINRRLIRPLLLASREEISRYAEENSISWREDRSNNTDDYRRNLIRHKVMPVIQQLNQSLESTFNVTSERLKAANVLLEEYLQNWKSGIIEKEGGAIRIPIKRLLNNSEPGYRLWSILQDYDFSYSQIKAIVACLRGIPGKQFFSRTHILLVDRTHIILKKHSKDSSQDAVTIEESTKAFEWGALHFEMKTLDRGEPISYNEDTITVDADLLTFPLTVRRWQQGDIFLPFGMNGKKKKVSDLLIDRKLDRFEKEKTGVLQNGNGEIVWVIGMRADERFRVRETSKNVLVISIHNCLEDNSEQI